MFVLNMFDIKPKTSVSYNWRKNIFLKKVLTKEKLKI